MSKIVKDSFVAVSDFHSYRWPFNKIKDYYLNEYDKIFILGDATDRGPKNDGTGGVELLLDIKKLCEKYPDRVFYVPGNHDKFLYDFIESINEMIKEYNLYGTPTEKTKNRYNDKGEDIAINHGSKTIEDIIDLKRKQPEVYEDLYKWLGKLPMQRTHEFNGKKYAFVHALFDNTIYINAKDFCFDDVKKYGKLEDRKRLNNIIWFRKDNSDFQYDPKYLPSSDYIMVIGHTPLGHRGNNLDLVNGKGETVKVVCVDGGIAYDGTMLKFDGTFDDAIGTKDYDHEDTSPKPRYTESNQNKLNKSKEQELKMATSMLNEIIEKSLKNNCSISDITNAILYGNVNGLPEDNILRQQAKLIAENYIKTLISKIAIENINYTESNRDYEVILHNYIIEIALRVIITSLKDYYTNIGNSEPLKMTSNQIKGFLVENDPTYITRKAGNSRNIVKKIGSDSFKKIIKLNECTNINEFINKFMHSKQNY